MTSSVRRAVTPAGCAVPQELVMVPGCDILLGMAKGSEAASRPRQANGLSKQSYQAQTGQAKNGHQPSLADMPAEEQGRILLSLHPESQAREVETLLTQARAGLGAAAVVRDISGVIAYRSQANAIQKICVELRLKDLKFDAMELSRRADRKLGQTIRDAQQHGEVAVKGQNRHPQKICNLLPKKELSGDEGNNGVYALTDGLTDEEFEQVLTQARDGTQTGLSRTNVARLCRAVRKPEPKPEKPAPTGGTSLTLDEVAKLAKAMPKKYQMLVLLTAWCGLHFGELQELRRGDIDIDERLIRVRRAVKSRTSFIVYVMKPGSRTPPRDVVIPEALVPALKDHLVQYVEPDMDAFLFPANHGGHLAISTLQNQFYRARYGVGFPALRLDDVRRTQLTATESAPQILQEITDAPPPRKVRKTAAARKVMTDIFITMNSLAFIAEETDPWEVDLTNHKDDITDVFRSMDTIRKFLNKVKEQDK
jgi:integrase